MKKGYLVGGLAIVGGIALLALLGKKRGQNSEGFYNARGTGFATQPSLNSTSTVLRPRMCTRLEDNGSYTQYTAHGDSRPCPHGGTVRPVVLANIKR